MKNSLDTKKCKQNNKKHSQKRKIAIALSVVLLLPIVGFAVFVGGFAIWAKGISLDKSLLPTQSAMPTFYDNDGEKIDYDEDSYIPPKDIPKMLADAFVALEDKRFYTHKGFDVVRMGGAILNNIKAGKVKEGASTITQQLVKNTHLSQERTISRKLKEIAIAIKLEEEYDKDEILSMYLSVIYFGNGAYGVKSASKLYFDKDINELNVEECATLAGIVKNPSKYSPFAKEADCINRRNLVLSTMKKEGYLSEKEYSNAINAPLLAFDGNNKKSNNNPKPLFNSYIKKVINEACDVLNITKYQLENSGYEIFTNLDVNLQSNAYSILKDKSNYENEKVEGQIVLVNNLTHGICAYASTLNYDVSRSCGSVIKPLAVYAPAIDMNMINLATPIVDEVVDFSGYSPKNFGEKYYGDTTIRQAIKKSMNSVAVKTMSYLGVDNARKYLSKFGIKTNDKDNNFSLALGSLTLGVDSIDIANAYSTFANSGKFCKNSFVKSISANGRKIYTFESKQKQIIKKPTADIINSVLLDTVKDGTAIALSTLPFEICAKTGTQERDDGKNSDTFCASYNQGYTMVVWHGCDDGMSEKGGGHASKQSCLFWKKIGNMYPMQSKIKYSDESVVLNVDTYATNRNKSVTIASENTPLEYRKSEIFARDSHFEKSTCFDCICDDDIDFTVKKSLGKVYIKIGKTQPIYSYEIYCEDMLGKRLITSCAGVQNDTFETCDTPLAIFGYATYTLICKVTTNEDVQMQKQIAVYFDNDDYSIDYINFCIEKATV